MSAMAMRTSSRPTVDPDGERSRRGVRVQLNNVVKDYPAAGSAFTRAIGPASLNVNPGEFVVVVGPSGCGKTTLLKLLAGMITPTAGTISMGDIGNGTRARTGMVFQAASLYPWRRLVDNVSFGLELRANGRLKDMSNADIKERASGLLQLVGLNGFENYYPHQVSGGMQQRVNLARALAIAPSLLLMDEPFSALDAQTREELQLDHLRQLRGGIGV
jgi:ABC-type nitrate/sulfonate/bicarbonate transport system ATPase subunit